MNETSDELHAISNCKTAAEVFQIAQLKAGQLGLQNTSLVFHIPISAHKSRNIIFSNYPKTWEETYIRRNYLKVDPTIRHGLRSTLPMLWSEASIREAPEFWEEAHGYGLCEGILQSVWDPHGCGTLLSFSRDVTEMGEAEFLDTAPKVAWLARLMHAGMSRLILPKEIPATATDLSPKEKQVLNMIASGKSSQDIADDLKLSRRVVDFHANQAIGKLGAENGTHATVIAADIHLIY